MKSNFTSEAISLCETILDTTSPAKVWGVVNLVKSTKSNRPESLYRSNEYPEIPQGFYYEFDEIPEHLHRLGVLPLLHTGIEWFLKVGVSRFTSHEEPEFQFHMESVFDGLTFYASKRGWINKGVDLMDVITLRSFSDPNVELEVIENTLKQGSVLKGGRHVVRWYSDGPNDRFHLVALFDRQKMQQFVNEQKNLTPTFNEETKTLEYLGQTVGVSGEHARMIKMLVEHCNSLVTWKELFELDGGSYDAEVKRLSGKRESIHSVLESRYKYIKNKVYENEILSKHLCLVQHEGFGLFVDQRLLSVS